MSLTDLSTPEVELGLNLDYLQDGLLVVGGMHGNEPLGPAVIDYLHKYGEYTRTQLGNPAAVSAGKRFMHCEISTVSSGPDPDNTECLDARQLHWLVKECLHWPLVVDIHDTLFGEYALTGPDPDPKLLRIAAFLGRHDILLSDIKFNVLVPQALTVEYQRPSDPAAIDGWVECMASEVGDKLEQLGEWACKGVLFSELPPVNLDNFQFYKDWSQDITDEEAASLELASVSVSQMFQQLDPETASALRELRGAPEGGSLHAKYWNGICPGEGYFAGIAEKCDPPDVTRRLLAR